MTNRVADSLLESEASHAPEEVVEEFNAMIDQQIAAGQRDPSIPAGTLLGESNVEGMPMRWKKQNSMHHINGIPLPERMPLYHWPDNETSLIPTALIFRRLTKTDGAGHRVWSRQPFPDGSAPEYLYKEVPVLGGRTMTRKFVSEDDYEQFMENKFPTAWRRIQREREREERAEDRAETRAVMQALLAASGKSQQKPNLEHLNADGLRAVADEFGVELSNRQSVAQMREEIDAALGGD